MSTVGEAVTCRREGCGHRYSGEHAPGGGNCMVWDPATGERCDCPGFQWVPLAPTRPANGPPVGSYSDPPRPT